MGKGAVTKGYIQNLYTKELKRFIYNPEEFEYGFSTDFATIKAPGSPLPLYQMVGGNEKTISVTLFLDGREGPADTIKKWQVFLESFHPTRKGNMNSFQSVGDAWFCVGPFLKNVIIKDVSLRFTMFDKNLNPIRAEATLSMEICQEFV